MPDDASDLLGIAPHATVHEINDAYRRAIRRCHPDLVGLGGVAATQRLNAASETALAHIRRHEANAPHTRRTEPVPHSTSPDKPPAPPESTPPAKRNRQSKSRFLSALASLYTLAFVATALIFTNPMPAPSTIRVVPTLAAFATLRLVASRETRPFTTIAVLAAAVITIANLEGIGLPLAICGIVTVGAAMTLRIMRRRG